MLPEFGHSPSALAMELGCAILARMLHRTEDQARKARQMLLLATVFWGLSFPTMKALSMTQQELLPDASTWFITAVDVLFRFLIAGLIMLAWCYRTVATLTAREIWQGLGLGLFGGAGMLFQMDGLAHTSASTSAFLTQFYCLLLPLIVAVRDRRRPTWLLLAGCLMVMGGVAVLSNVDLVSFRIGRGEIETLIGSVLFAGQILWLERPAFSSNRFQHSSLVMFFVMALITVPVALATTAQASDWVVAFSQPSILGFMAVLILFCTLCAFIMMNRWQPHIPAAQAGLIYGAEPVLASMFALVLPGWYSAVALLNYPNEQLTTSLLIGGSLIVGANLLNQTKKTAEPGAFISKFDRA
jgi:drug/metabolite transporter (DMT)-like permease